MILYGKGKSFVDDLIMKLGIVSMWVALCYELLRFSPLFRRFVSNRKRFTSHPLWRCSYLCLIIWLIQLKISSSDFQKFLFEFDEYFKYKYLKVRVEKSLYLIVLFSKGFRNERSFFKRVHIWEIFSKRVTSDRCASKWFTYERAFSKVFRYDTTFSKGFTHERAFSKGFHIWVSFFKRVHICKSFFKRVHIW